ncbi:Hsp70 family protein [Salininema proteolyticum]|uniref:Hsp70 family protein n=1 Tax=Salininema proteolyticum TaxID=1607685 RepID=A0ABV8U221_9ACTN
MTSPPLLAVDIGTSNSVGVLRDSQGNVRPLLIDGSPVTPSAVYLDDEGTLHTGRDAETLAAAHPDRFEPNPKKRTGDGEILLGLSEVSVTEVFAALLRRMADAAGSVTGDLPAVVLTCPQDWGERRRRALREAATKAGFTEISLVTEPVAAAYYYAERLSIPIAEGEAIVVFDFGGGTLDIALAQKEPGGGFRVAGAGGLEDLGGLDIDAALVDHLGETVAAAHPEEWDRLTRPGNSATMRDRIALWRNVRSAKEMLSRAATAPVAVPGIETSFHLTRREMDELARPILARAAGELERVLDMSALPRTAIAGVFLVGGSTRMPLVSQVLHERTGFAPRTLEQPEIPVAEGALAARDRRTSGVRESAPPARLQFTQSEYTQEPLDEPTAMRAAGARSEFLPPMANEPARAPAAGRRSLQNTVLVLIVIGLFFFFLSLL